MGNWNPAFFPFMKNFGLPVISGSPGFIGTVLTCTPSASYQWTRDGVNISGATSQTYMQGPLDVGPSLRCVSPAGTSNSLAYTPLLEGSSLIDWLDPRTLAPGPVGSWAGRKGVFTATAAGAARPTASATSLNGTPGVTGDGVANILSGPLNLSALSSLRMIVGCVDATAVDSTVIEFTANVTTQDGSFRVEVNFGASTIHVWARGTTAVGVTAFSEALSTPQVLGACPDTSLTTACQYVQINGLPLDSTGIIASCGPGNFANSTLNIFARAGGTTSYPGTLGDFVFMTGNAQNAQLDRVNRFITYRMTLPQWTRVMPCGDSITYGLVADTGGWRPAAMTTLGAQYYFVGPLFRFGYNRGNVNERASQVVAAIGTFAAELVTYFPDKVVLAWGMNDMGNGRTPAQFFADMTTIINQIKTTLPACVIVVQSVVLPAPPSAYFAQIGNYNIVNAAYPAFCAAAGCLFANIGAPTVGADGIHPIDGAGGYPIMVAPTVAQL